MVTKRGIDFKRGRVGVYGGGGWVGGGWGGSGGGGAVRGYMGGGGRID